jgi:hypothetical protein
MCFSKPNTSKQDKANKQAQEANQRAQEQNLALSAQQRSDEQARQQQLRADEEFRQFRTRNAVGEIDNVFGRFDDNFFKGKADQLVQAQSPQLTDQYKKAQEQTLYGLARQGLNNSSASTNLNSELARTYGEQQQRLQSDANSYEQKLRSQVEQNRNDLVTQAQSIADPNLTVSSANTAAGNLAMVEPTANASFSNNYGNVFDGITSALKSGVSGYAYGKEGLLDGGKRADAVDYTKAKRGVLVR